MAGSGPAPRNHAPVLRAVPDVTADQYGTTQVQLHAADRDRGQARLLRHRPARRCPASTPATGLVTIQPTHRRGAGPDRLRHRRSRPRRDDDPPDRRAARRPRSGSRSRPSPMSTSTGWTDGGANFVREQPGRQRRQERRLDRPHGTLAQISPRRGPGPAPTTWSCGWPTGPVPVAPDAVSFRDAARHPAGHGLGAGHRGAGGS